MVRTLLLCLAAAVGTTWTMSPAFAAPPNKQHSEKVAERVSRGVIHEALEELDQPESRERMGRVLNSPQMQEAMRDLSASIVMGVFEGVRAARTAGATSDADLGESIGASIDEHVTPAVGRMMYRMVDSAVSASLANKHLGQVEKFGEGASHAVARGVARGLEQDLGPALAATIDKDLGPAVAVVIARDILPAIGRGLDTPEMQAAMANLTRSVATEIVGGAGDAIDVKTEENEAEGKESGLQLFGDKVAFGYGIAMFVSFALGTMLVVLTVVLVRNSRRLRKQSEAAQEREDALLHLIDSLKTDSPELKSDMRNLLEDQLAAAQ